MGPHAPEFGFFWPRVCIQTALMPLVSLSPLSRDRKRRTQLSLSSKEGWLWNTYGDCISKKKKKRI